MSSTRSSEKELLEKISQIVEDNLAEGQFGVSELAREMGMVRTSLHRRVKSATGASASKFIRGVRLKKAMDLLKETTLPISEVAFECGFRSVTYFTTCFHDHYGYPPSKAGKDEAEKYNSEDIRHPDAKSGMPRRRLYVAIIGSALFVILVLLVLFFVLQPFTSRDQSLEKSIAVLPFVNDSPVEENTYFINGLLEDLTIRLQAIKDIRVPGRPSVENYRNTTRSIPEIAKALNVSYVLVGSAQKYGNQFKLRVQLIEGANDKQLWAASYEEEIRPEDIYEIQSQITQAIAEELEAIITPQEKQLIEKVPTSNQMAYEFYLKGEEELRKYVIETSNKEALRTAEYLYLTALEYDSTFAQVYVSLAWLNVGKGRFDSIMYWEYMDSALILADRALRYDNQLAAAYHFKGHYFTRKGKSRQALSEYDSAIKLNPNNHRIYGARAMLYYYNNDFLSSISDWYKAISLNADPESVSRISAQQLRMLGMCYYLAGFHEKATSYINIALVLEKDSARHYHALSRIRGYANTFRSSIEAGEKAISLGLAPLSEVRISRNLGQNCLFIGRHVEALEYFERAIELNQSVGEPQTMYSPIGFAYWINGLGEKAEYYYNKQIKFCTSTIELYSEAPQKYRAHYSLAGVYVCMEQKDKAYEHLHKFSLRPRMSLQEVRSINKDPLFDSIRDETEFQQIVREIEAKYQIEHERVRRWLEENDML